MNIANESNRTKIRAQRIANKDRGIRALSYPDTGKSNGGRCRTRTCDPLGVNQVRDIHKCNDGNDLIQNENPTCTKSCTNPKVHAGPTGGSGAAADGDALAALLPALASLTDEQREALAALLRLTSR